MILSHLQYHVNENEHDMHLHVLCTCIFLFSSQIASFFCDCRAGSAKIDTCTVVTIGIVVIL